MSSQFFAIFLLKRWSIAMTNEVFYPFVGMVLAIFCITAVGAYIFRDKK